MSNTNECNEALWNPEQTARFLNLESRNTLASWRNRRQGPPFIRVGTCIRYAPAAVRAWLASRTVEQPAAAPV